MSNFFFSPGWIRGELKRRAEEEDDLDKKRFTREFKESGSEERSRREGRSSRADEERAGSVGEAGC